MTRRDRSLRFGGPAAGQKARWGPQGGKAARRQGGTGNMSGRASSAAGRREQKSGSQKLETVNRWESLHELKEEKR